MKKLLLPLFLFLYSCGNNPSLVETSDSISWSLEIATHSWEVLLENEEESKWDSLPTIQHSLKMNGYNVVLMNGDQELGLLTTKWNSTIEDVHTCDRDIEKYAYKILQSEGEYGVVMREWNSCWWPAGDTYFAIPLRRNADRLTEIYDNLYSFDKVSFDNNVLVVKNTLEVTTHVDEDDPWAWWGTISPSILQEKGFVQEWDEWVKRVILSEVSYPEEWHIDTSASEHRIRKLSDFTIISDKSFFHDEWWDVTKAYLIYGDVVKVEKVSESHPEMNEQNYYYAEFTNKQWKKTTGYLHASNMVEGVLDTHISQKASQPKKGVYRKATDTGGYYMGYSITIESVSNDTLRLWAGMFHRSHWWSERLGGTSGLFEAWGNAKKSWEGWNIIVYDDLEEECMAHAKFTENAVIVSSVKGANCPGLQEQTYLYTWEV